MNKYPKNQSELSDMAWSYRVGLVKIARETGMLPKLIDDVADYFDYHGIQDVVLGVSGGVDSALALAVLVEVQKRQHLNIHAEVILFDVYNGIFDPSHVRTMRAAYPSVNWHTCHMNDAFYEMAKVMNRDFPRADKSRCGFSRDATANITYAMRYQVLFARAQQVGGITIGTTNRDELEYAGWFGKNSDMVTDMQFLWRLPKCLVLDFARELQVPDAIINRVPVGDLIDRSSDEQNFGCTYDELRWYTDIGRTHRVNRVGEHTEFMLQKFDKLEELHRKNSHKYATKGITHYNPVFL